MRLLRVSLALTLLSAANAQTPNAADLIGRWRSATTSKGGIGAMYTFHANGTVDFSPGAIVEMKFRTDGNQMFLSAPGEPEAPSAIAWTADGKLRLGIGTQFEEFRRQGPAAEPGRLAGEWLGEREMNGAKVPVRWIFDATGKAVLLIAFKTEAGNYVERSGGIGASFTGGGTLQATYVVKDGILTLTRGEGRVQRFARY